MHILPPLTPLRVSLQNVLLVLFFCICRILMLASNQCFITSLLPFKLLSNIPAAFQVSSCGLHFIHLYPLYFTSLTLTSLATFFFNFFSSCRSFNLTFIDFSAQPCFFLAEGHAQGQWPLDF